MHTPACSQKKKIPPSCRDEGDLRGTTLVDQPMLDRSITITGANRLQLNPWFHRKDLSRRMDGRRVQPRCSANTCRAHTLSGSLADSLLLLPRSYTELSGGPSGIRTHDLLNAIETRSQLRHGPSSGPGGIRTRDLISAIDARSQLRYRPATGARIVPESGSVSQDERLGPPFYRPGVSQGTGKVLISYLRTLKPKATKICLPGGSFTIP